MAKKDKPPPPKHPKDLEVEVFLLLEEQLPDETLRQKLEALATNPDFKGLTYLWGPVLYRRNRAMFRPFILIHFSVRPSWDWLPIPWEHHAEALDPWLEEVDRRGDVELFRRLYAWKHAQDRWDGFDEEQWREDLLAAFRAAKQRYERNQVLNKFDLGRGMALDEKTAVELYEVDPAAARPFILKHPPVQERGGGDRQLPAKLCEQARQQGDEALYFALYRMMVPQKTWEKDVETVAQEVKDPRRLVEELEKRHPAQDWGVDPGRGFYALATARGRDVVPYLLKHLDSLWTYHARMQHKLLDHARAEGWWDVWSVLVRKGDNDQYNKEVLALVKNHSRPDEETFRRLVRLSGASSEWNFGRFGWEKVQYLKDETAVVLYERFPELVHGPFRKHLSLHEWNSDGLPKLTIRALRENDRVLLDYLASQAVLAGRYDDLQKRAEQAIGRLERHYEKLRADPAAFARRVASVLGQLPAGSVGRSYREVLKKNRLARMLFEESAPALLQDPLSVRDLLEAAEIHAQLLALRVLGQDDERARRLAADNLDLLQATLLRDLHRKSRLLALRALANAATTAANACQIVTKARQALALPDKGYPKEQVLSLVADLYRRWPELRRATEQPVVFRSKKKRSRWARPTPGGG